MWCAWKKFRELAPFLTSLRKCLPITELQRRPFVESIRDIMRRCRLRLHGPAECKDNADWVKACCKLVLEGSIPDNRSKKI